MDTSCEKQARPLGHTSRDRAFRRSDSCPMEGHPDGGGRLGGVVAAKCGGLQRRMRYGRPGRFTLTRAKCRLY